MNEVGSWSRRDFVLRGRHILIEEEGGSWLLQEEAYCWKWKLLMENESDSRRTG